MGIKEKVCLYWLRRDLRLHDNTGLFKALNAEGNVLPLFIYDTNILGLLSNKQDRRVDFIAQVIDKLHADLVQKGSSLLVRSGSPLKVFSDLLNEYHVTAVYCSEDYEPYAIQRDELVKGALLKKGVRFVSVKDQVIFDYREIRKSDGSPYTVFTSYSRKWSEKFTAECPSPAPSEKLPDRLHKTKPLPLVSFEDIGFKKTGIRFAEPHVDADLIKNYHLTRDVPSKNATSRLGIHLRFGTISIRQVAKKAAAQNDVFLKELIWREFFMMILRLFPHVTEAPFKSDYRFMEWRNSETEFRRWQEGKTGYPMVDAGMRELATTGFMHNRVRMITASFLTKHLLIDWRWGEAWFASLLDDFELSSNNGNWQWAAGCGCDAAPYFRIFNPEEQQKRFDPAFIYIKKWVPEFGTPLYPAPMVDHKFARERALSAFKKALLKAK